MKFSIVLPTRERPELLNKLIDSIALNTYDLKNVEVLIAMDEDDATVYGSFPHWVHIFRVKRSLNFSRDYYTFLAKLSSGRWIITVNDDCTFETKHWDKICEEILIRKPSVVFGRSDDGIGEYRVKGHGDYCCFPLQGRGGFEALGYIFPENIPTWGADIWVGQLYSQLRSKVTLPIMIKHCCHHNKTREQDAISKRIANNQVQFDLRPSYTQINTLLAALRKEMVMT